MTSKFLIAVVATAAITAGSGPSLGAEKVKAGILKMAALTNLWVAKQEGIFEKNGLDVELIEFRNGNEAINAHRSGSVDFILSIPGTAMTAAELPQSDDDRAHLHLPAQHPPLRHWPLPERPLKARD